VPDPSGAASRPAQRARSGTCSDTVVSSSLPGAPPGAWPTAPKICESPVPAGLQTRAVPAVRRSERPLRRRPIFIVSGRPLAAWTTASKIRRRSADALVREVVGGDAVDVAWDRGRPRRHLHGFRMPLRGMRGCSEDSRGIGVLADERRPPSRARRACHARYPHRFPVPVRALNGCLPHLGEYEFPL
jgi:hypothetical protein